MIQVLQWLTFVSVTKSGLDYTCAVVVADDDANGDITYSIAFTDAAGNAGTAVTSGSGSVTIDNTHPGLSSVAIATNGDGDASNGDTVSLTFTASEALLANPTCTISDSGATMANVVSVTKSGLDYTCAVVVADDDANGDITYSIAFTDAAGNAGTAVTSGSGSVTIDNTHPGLSSVAIATNGDGDASNADTVSLTFTASEALLANPTCTISDSGATMANVVSVTKSGLDYTCAVVVADDDANGDITYSIAFTDAAGNAGTAVTSGSGSVTIDNTHPGLSSVAIATNGDGDASNGDTVSLTFTASEALLANPTCTISDSGATMANVGICH